MYTSIYFVIKLFYSHNDLYTSANANCRINEMRVLFLVTPLVVNPGKTWWLNK